MLNEPKKNNILEFSKDQLRSWLTERKIASYRADQIQKWIYLRQADRFDVMTDLSKEIRMLLSQHFMIGRLKVEQIEFAGCSLAGCKAKQFQCFADQPES